MAQLQKDYENAKGWREVQKYAFAIGTFGLGALYLWATTSIIKQGEIGLRRNNRGEMILLPPGRHSNFPWETYPVEPQSLSEKILHLGPYKIITVESGYIAKTLNQGKLEILEEGQHVLKDTNHVFDSFISVKQETKTLHPVVAYTNDNVGLTLLADVRYQIENPEQAIRQTGTIDKSITEIAEMSISEIMSHHDLADFAPVTHVGQDQHRGISHVMSELTTKITEQFRQLGIQLLNIAITSWSINDKELAHEVAQVAVIQSQTEAQGMLTKADAEAKIVIAQSDAEAMKLTGAAIKELADQFKDNLIAHDIFARSQQAELVRGANHPNLYFFQPLASGGGQLPQITVPVVTSTR